MRIDNNNIRDDLTLRNENGSFYSWEAEETTTETSDDSSEQKIPTSQTENEIKLELTRSAW